MADDIAHWLKERGLDRLTQTFLDNGIDLDVLAQLTDADLREIGVNLGDRRRLLRTLNPETTVPVVESGGPVRYTPPQHLAARILNSRSALEGERKQITVLFADIKGSTELIDGLDPEQAIMRLEPALKAMIDAVHRYEGTINKIQGDGIMALFGAPLAHEDHAVRACHAAIAIQKTIDQSDEAELSIRIGLHSGEVVVRSIANDLSMNYDAVGPTVHLAGRMEQLAEPKSIRMTASTYQLAMGFIDARALGPISVKGISEPVELFELVGSAPERSRWEVRAAAGLSQFVGREAEVERLTGLCRAAAWGRGQIVSVVGDPGMGKSRLVHEFINSHVPRDWTILETGGLPQSRDVTYFPIRKLLHVWFGIEEADTQSSIAKCVLEKVRGLDEQLLSATPALYALLDLPVEDTEWQRLDPPQRRARIIDAVRAMALQSAQDQPVLLLFEDLHWIDTETQAVLDSLVDGLTSSKLLLMVTYRPEYEHEWTDKSYYSGIYLDPLPEAQVSTLLGSLLGDDPDLDRLKQLLSARAEGTPLFLEETVKMLIDTGFLEGDRTNYRLIKTVDEIEIPATVQAMLAARIDRLPVEQKSLLQVASVIGNNVPGALLSAIAGLAEDELRQGLDVLQSLEFLFETRTFPEPEYTFKHALTHDVAYGSVLVERRRLLHAQLVELIEVRYQNRLDEQIELLAYHASSAGNWEKAQSHNRRAAMKALSRSAYRVALGNFERALAALEELPAEVEWQQDKMDVRLEMRSALFPLGEHAAWVARVREVEAMAKDAGDRRRLAMVHNYLTPYFWQRGQHEDAIAHGEAGLKLTEELDDFSTRISTMFHLGLPYQARGEYRRQTDLHRSVAQQLIGASALERHGMAGLPGVISRALLAWGLSELGDFEEAETWAKEAIEIAEQGSNAYSTVWAYDGLAITRLRQGKLDEAIELSECALKLCRDAEVRIVLSITAGILGCAYSLSQDLCRAVPLLEEALRPENYDRSICAYANIPIWLALAYSIDGQTDRAQKAADYGLRLCRDRGERSHEAWALHLLGDMEAQKRNERTEKAGVFYRQAVEIAGQLEMRPLIAHCRYGLGKLHQGTGKAAEARAELQEAIDLYRALEMTFWLPNARAEFAQLMK